MFVLTNYYLTKNQYFFSIIVAQQKNKQTLWDYFHL
jgi:hypothetical protein